MLAGKIYILIHIYFIILYYIIGSCLASPVSFAQQFFGRKLTSRRSLGIAQAWHLAKPVAYATELCLGIAQAAQKPEGYALPEWLTPWKNGRMVIAPI